MLGVVTSGASKQGTERIIPAKLSTVNLSPLSSFFFLLILVFLLFPMLHTEYTNDKKTMTRKIWRQNLNQLLDFFSRVFTQY
jgi:hypothetical protein